MDTDVKEIIDASIVTDQIKEDDNSPPVPQPLALWSPGFLQTRQTWVRYTVLMGTFVNKTGSNVTQIRIPYSLTIAGDFVKAEEENKGTRVYYSLTRAPGT